MAIEAPGLFRHHQPRLPRHQRSDDAADGAAHDGRRRPPQAQGGAYHGRHHRYRRQHWAEDAPGDRGQSADDDRDCAGRPCPRPARLDPALGGVPVAAGARSYRADRGAQPLDRRLRPRGRRDLGRLHAGAGRRQRRDEAGHGDRRRPSDRGRLCGDGRRAQSADPALRRRVMTAAAVPAPVPIAERGAVDAETFAREILPGYRPVVLRGQVAAWPAVAAGRAGPREAAAYLARFAGPRPTDVMIGPPAIGGRFYYADDMRGFNFTRQQVPLPALIARLLALLDRPDGYALYAGAAAADDHLPGWTAANALDLPLPA